MRRFTTSREPELHASCNGVIPSCREGKGCGLRGGRGTSKVGGAQSDMEMVGNDQKGRISRGGRGTREWVA